jgi:hypothetical protein
VPQKRLCYLTSQGVVAYAWTRGELRQEAVFAAGEKGVAEFTAYVVEAPESLYYVLADVVEEDFFLENVPYVRGADRRALLSRRVAQRYRDTTLAIPVSLGTEIHAGRREERILFTSFTNTQQFQPWLGALRSNEARLAGVFSVAFVAPSVVKRMRLKGARYLLVSLQQAGLRQSYVENGRIRFSRLSRVQTSDPRAAARDCATESIRIYQYLANSRILPRQAPPLEVVVLAPSEHKALYEAECVSSPRLQFHVRDLDQVARSLGIKSAPATTLGEGVFLHVLAQSAPRDQFADDDLRRFYDIWRARVGLVAAGAAVFGLCLAISAAQILWVYQINQQVQFDRLQEERASREYANMQAAFPKTPTSAENLKAVVKNYRLLARQSTFPGDMFVEISRAITALPQIEIEKIEWDAGAGARTSGGAREASKAPTTSPSPERPGEPRSLVQTAEISGKLNLPQVSDYRAITALINEFAEALRKQPGIEVIRTQLPFDLAAEKSISGDIGAARRAEVPRFSVSVNRRQGT